MPGCVAKPPEQVPYRGRLVPRTTVYADAYRGYDHRNCAHPTPLPTGWRRCAGDSGCHIRLPTYSPRRLCASHEDLAWNQPADQTERLMGAWRDGGAPLAEWTRGRR